MVRPDAGVKVIRPGQARRWRVVIRPGMVRPDAGRPSPAGMVRPDAGVKVIRPGMVRPDAGVKVIRPGMVRPDAGVKVIRPGMVRPGAGVWSGWHGHQARRWRVVRLAWSSSPALACGQAGMVIKPDAGVWSGWHGHQARRWRVVRLAWSSSPTLATFTRWHGQARRWRPSPAGMVRPDAGDLHPLAWSGPTLADLHP